MIVLKPYTQEFKDTYITYCTVRDTLDKRFENRLSSHMRDGLLVEYTRLTTDLNKLRKRVTESEFNLLRNIDIDYKTFLEKWDINYNWK